MKPAIPVKRLDSNPDLPLPAYETVDAAGMDLRASVPEGEPMVLMSRRLARED